MDVLLRTLWCRLHLAQELENKDAVEAFRHGIEVANKSFVGYEQAAIWWLDEGDRCLKDKQVQVYAYA